MKGLLRSIARRTYRTLVPPRGKNTLNLWLLLDKRDAVIEPITEFTADPVVVLAPHMDDEIAGCGGVLCKHIQAGARVTVIYLTDGRRGDPTLYQEPRDKQAILTAEDALVARRKREARASADVIGINDLVFLDQPDGQLEVTDELTTRIRELLIKVRPHVVYLPSVLDSHEDHWAANRVLHAAVKSTGRAPLTPMVFRGYEVWSPLLANRVADISDTLKTKLEALLKFESQTAHIDYARVMEGLNAYRSIHALRGHGHAEAFLEFSPAEFDVVMQRIGRPA